jgi:hypothetical protein
MDDTIQDTYCSYGSDDVDAMEREIRAAVPGAFINREFDYGAGLVTGRPDKSGAIIVFKAAQRGHQEIKTPLDEVVRFLTLRDREL